MNNCKHEYGDMIIDRTKAYVCIRCGETIKPIKKEGRLKYWAWLALILGIIWATLTK